MRNRARSLSALPRRFLAPSISCATSPPVEVDGLALKRVVIYRNGVAYFEREGRVSGNRVSFRVRGDEVGDFLASFAVMEKGGSSVRAASFPLHREEDVEPAPGDACEEECLAQGSQEAP